MDSRISSSSMLSRFFIGLPLLIDKRSSSRWKKKRGQGSIPDRRKRPASRPPVLPPQQVRRCVGESGQQDGDGQVERDKTDQEHPTVLPLCQEGGAHCDHIHCGHEGSGENGGGPQEVPLEKEEQQDSRSRQKDEIDGTDQVQAKQYGRIPSHTKCNLFRK